MLDLFRNWTELISPDGEIIQVKNTGIGYFHKMGDCHLVWDSPTRMVRDITSQDLKLFFYNYTPKEGDIVFDIGAGVGTEVFEFSKRVGKMGKVYCFEPDPLAFKRLKRIVRTMKLRNVILERIAVGNVDGIVALSQESDLGTTNRTVGVDEGIEVPMKKLDTLLKEYAISRVDYLKMNIEGGELPVISSFSNFSKIANWCIACHDFTGDKNQQTKSPVSEIFTSKGMKVEFHPFSEKEPWASDYIYIGNSQQ